MALFAASLRQKRRCRTPSHDIRAFVVAVVLIALLQPLTARVVTFENAAELNQFSRNGSASTTFVFSSWQELARCGLSRFRMSRRGFGDLFDRLANTTGGQRLFQCGLR